VSAELVESLRGHLDELTGLVRDLPRDRLEGGRASSGGWTARQVLAHLADFELIAAVRVRVVLTRDRPALAAYGQEEFTERFGALESPAQALERFAVNRRATVGVLEALGPEDWERTGVHPQRGEESLRRTVESLAIHDRMHLDQLREAAGA
jgi:uncharacterized damage-inducible protein DinB